MNELSLFSGAGGGLLGTHCLMGFRTVGYVEINNHCQQVIAQRIKDGYFDEAPVFGDIRTFISEGYAASYQGMVDVVTAGFPCQPFSVAGKKRGEKDERNLWPETREVIRLVRPRYVLLENVPGLLAHQYFGTILNELAEGGDCVPWRCLSAAEVGAPHRRDRVWIVAYSNCKRETERYFSNSVSTVTSEISERRNKEDKEISCTNIDNDGNVADPQGERLGKEGEYSRRHQKRATKCGEILADSEGKQIDGEGQGGFQPISAQCGDMAYSAATGLEGQEPASESRQCNRLLAECDWWSTDPADGPVKSRLGRVAHGVAHRVDRLKAIGEGQVPAVVRAVWELMAGADTPKKENE